MAKKIGKQVVLPKAEAFKMSIRSIKIRFGRVIIVSSSIMLGVAFLMAIFTTNLMHEALLTGGPEAIRLSLASAAEDTRARDIWLVVLSLLVCVVGITNAMLMAVSERSREIGTMKCLGALNRYVMEIFLIEAMLLGLLGSLVGGFLGALAMILTSAVQFGGVVFAHIPYLAIFYHLLVAVVLGTTIAIIGALYPTYLSAKMEPAEAIRREF